MLSVLSFFSIWRGWNCDACQRTTKAATVMFNLNAQLLINKPHGQICRVAQLRLVKEHELTLDSTHVVADVPPGFPGIQTLPIKHNFWCSFLRDVCSRDLLANLLRFIPIGILQDSFLQESYRTREYMDIRCEGGKATNAKNPIGIFQDSFLLESYRSCKSIGLHSCIRCESGKRLT